MRVQTAVGTNAAANVEKVGRFLAKVRRTPPEESEYFETT